VRARIRDAPSGGLVGSFGLWRSVLRRDRADLAVALAAALLLLAATTLVVSAVMYGETVATGGLRRALEIAPPAARAVAIRTTVAADEARSVEATVAGELGAALGEAGGRISRVTRSAALSVVGAGTGASAGTAAGTGASAGDLTFVAAHDALGSHAALVDGRWPRAGADPLEVTLSESAARSLGLGVGDRVGLVGRAGQSRVVDVLVTGLWRADPTDAYWMGSPLELDGIQVTGTFTTRGPFVADAADLARLPGAAGSTDIEWRAVPEIPALQVGDLDRIAADLSSLRERLRTAIVPTRDISVTTDLPAVLTSVSRSVVVSRAGIALLTLQFGVLALYAILLVAGMLVDRRRLDIALLRSRGASSAHLAGMALLEALVLALPAVLLAPVLGLGIVRLLGAIGPLAEAGIVADVSITPAVLAVSAAAALVVIVAFAVPSVLSAADPGRVRAAWGRGIARTLPQRLGLDLVLVGLAALAIWQLGMYGSPLARDARGALGVDPLLVLAPAIGLVAGGVLAIRFLPRIAEIGEQLLRRGRGTVAPIGARQIARRPLRATRSTLLVLLAAALFVIAASYAATWTRSQADQAAYRAAADVRVTTSGFAALPPWAAGAAYRAIPGVTAAMPVESRPLDAGKSVRGGTLLALDPAAAAAMAALPSGPDGEAVRDGLARLGGAGGTDVGIPLPGRPAAIAITVDTDLTVDEPAEPLDPSLPRTPLVVTVAAVLADADGTLRRVEAAVPEPAEKGQRIVLPLTDEVGGTTASPAWPLELVAIEHHVASPSAATTRGTLEVTGVDATDDATAAAWAAVPLDSGAAGWHWTRTVASETTPYTPPASAPARVVMGDEPGMAPSVVGEIFSPAPGPTFRLSRLSASSATTAVPALAGTSFLEATGARVGDTVAASVSGLPVTLEIVGRADSFPPADPAVPFVVVDASTLARSRFAANGQTNTPQEWWLATDDGASGSVAAVVAGPPFSAAAVVDRAALERSLTSDPVPLGIIGAFGLGAIAAVLFAAIGFLVSASISTTERLGEFALLRALGLSPRQLAGWVSAESAFLLGFGFIGGALLGAILAWLVLPFSALTPTGERAVPTPAVIVPPEALSVLLAIGLGLLAVTVGVVRRRVLSVSVAGVLRARDA
jgi:hypothetical protein